MINMPCVSSDGKPTGTGIETLRAIQGGAVIPIKISETTGHPMFKVRSGLRELTNAGFLEQESGKYHLTELGKKAI